MSFMENLPSIVSSSYSRKDIELFDLYRDKYTRSVKSYKSLLSGLITTINMDLYSETAFTILGMGGGNTFSEQFKKDIYANSRFRCDQEIFLRETNHKTWNCARNLYSLDNEAIPQTHDLISAFYIPEDMEWITIKIWNFSNDYIRELYPEITINYNLHNNDPKGNLEGILDKSKDFSFLENREQTEDLLGDLLDRSKKTNIISDSGGEETIEICEINSTVPSVCKRVMLFHPVLPIINFVYSEITIETPEKRRIYAEYIHIGGLTKFRNIDLKYGFYESDNGDGLIFYDRGNTFSIDNIEDRDRLWE